MVNNRAEYQAMYAVEESHWWYKSLHRKVKEIVLKYAKPDSVILDAGCGTGGFLQILKKEGFKDLRGFDFDHNAVEFSQLRGLNVIQGDLLDLEKMFSEQSFDIIICNDVFCQFEKHEIIHALNSIAKILKKGGIFISNNQANELFYGIHDIAVGAKIRFMKADFDDYLTFVPHLKRQSYHYWSVLLSPLIFVARLSQRFMLKWKWADPSKAVSDVKSGGALANMLFAAIIKTEDKLILKRPFGSSIFQVFEKV
jgi:SAM-dependent methyltransferase